MARPKQATIGKANFGVLDKHIYFKDEVAEFMEELQAARALIEEKDEAIRLLETRIGRMARTARQGVEALIRGDDEHARQLFRDIQTDANRR